MKHPAIYSLSVIPAESLFPGQLIYSSAYCHFNCFSFKTLVSLWAFSPCNPLNLCIVWSLWPGMLPSPFTRASFMGMWPVKSHRAPHSEGLTLGLMLSCYCLEILSFIFELVFCRSSVMRQAYMWAEEICAICVSTVPYHLFHLQPSWFSWAQNSSGPTIHESPGRFRVKYKASMLCLQLRKWGHKGPKRSYFLFEPDLIWMQKEGNGILRSTNDHGTQTFPFLLMLLSCISQPLTLKWWHRRKT